jgi:predicted metal-binding protein
MGKRKLEILKKRALQLGVESCKIIRVPTVKTAPWVRYKCQFGCSGYGETLTCPPYSLKPEETAKLLKEYTRALLVHTRSGAKKDISRIVVTLEEEAFKMGYYKAWSMGAGPCRLCRSCDVTSLCRNAEKARPSMEACGIDVFQTVRSNGYTIETLDSYKCKANYFGLVLIE